jgi:hypothetical protein
MFAIDPGDILVGAMRTARQEAGIIAVERVRELAAISPFEIDGEAGICESLLELRDRVTARAVLKKEKCHGLPERAVACRRAAANLGRTPENATCRN